MDKLDFIQIIGSNTCTFASHISQFVASAPACAQSEVWNMGLLIVVSATLVIVVSVIAARRRLQRQDRNW
ncbi:MAG: hypothetical protein K8S25_15785 [Alphaproteobacteria bacterium]|nr:hypothetical protein [Alphaproteobacteria bacterium]